MKLFEIVGKEYAILETEYDARSIDTTYEDNEYTLEHSHKTTLQELRKHSKNECEKSIIAELIEYEDENDRSHEVEEIDVYEGTVSSPAKREWCAIYLPSWWD